MDLLQFSQRQENCPRGLHTRTSHPSTQRVTDVDAGLGDGGCDTRQLVLMPLPSFVEAWGINLTTLQLRIKRVPG